MDAKGIWNTTITRTNYSSTHKLKMASDRYKSTGDTSTPLVKKLKDLLKIKRRKNINYAAKTGQTPKAGIGKKKMASFRKTDAEMKKLQQETNDPNRTTVSYKRVTNKNKDKFSDQHLKKDEKKKGGATETKTKIGRAPKGYIKYGSKFVSVRTAQGKKALNKLKAKQRAQAAAKERKANK